MNEQRNDSERSARPSWGRWIWPWPAVAAVTFSVSLWFLHGDEGGASLRPDPGELVAAEHAEGIPLDLPHGLDAGESPIRRPVEMERHRTQILDSNEVPVAEATVFRIQQASHPRCLEDPAPVGRSDKEGWVELPAQGRVLLHHPRFRPTELECPTDRVVLERGASARVRIVDFKTGAPLVGVPIVVSQVGLWAEVNTDPSINRVPRAGRHGARFAVTDQDGWVSFDNLNDLAGPPHVAYSLSSEFLLHGGSVAETETHLRARRVSQRIIAGQHWLAVRADGSKPPPLKRANKELWLRGSGPPQGLLSSIVLAPPSDLATACIGLSEEYGWCRFHVDQADPVNQDHRPEGLRVVAPPDCELRVNVHGHTAMPLTVVTMPPAGEAQEALSFRILCGETLKLPAGEYQLFDPCGRPLKPAAVSLPSPPVSARVRSTLTPVTIDVRCRDGLVPAYPVILAKGIERYTWAGDTEWLPPGKTRIIVDHYGGTEFLVPRASGQLTRFDAVLKPVWSWSDTVPLGARLVRLADMAGVRIDPAKLDVEELSEIELSERAWRTSGLRIQERLDEIRERVMSLAQASDIARFTEQRLFWAQVKRSESLGQTNSDTYATYQETTCEQGRWLGLIFSVELRGHPEIGADLESLRAEMANHVRAFASWKKARDSRMIIIARAAAQ